MIFDYLGAGLIYLSYVFYLSDYDTMLKNLILNLSETNLLFIKMFQWFSYDFINNVCDEEEMISFFKNCLNKVPYNKNDIDRKELENLIQELKKNNKTLVIEDEPSNSGTIALAFKGKLDGKNVIIKTLRNDILNKITTDMNDIETISWILNTIFNNKNIKEISNFFMFNKVSIINQTNLSRELENINFFKEKFINASHIVIPHVYSNYSNSKLIIMDYIDNMENIKNLTKEENKMYLSLILKFYYNCIIVKKIIHCDMHLGNILFIKNIDDETKEIEYKIGIIDYGICLELDIDEQNFLDKAFSELMVNNLYNIFVEVVNHLIVKYKKDNKNYKIILEEIGKYIDTNKLNEKMMNLTHYDVYMFVKISKKYDLILPERIYNMLLSFVSIIGTVNYFLVAFEDVHEKHEYLKEQILK